jgi:hypothetical protein
MPLAPAFFISVVASLFFRYDSSLNFCRRCGRLVRARSKKRKPLQNGIILGVYLSRRRLSRLLHGLLRYSLRLLGRLRLLRNGLSGLNRLRRHVAILHNLTDASPLQLLDGRHKHIAHLRILRVDWRIRIFKAELTRKRCARGPS